MDDLISRRAAIDAVIKRDANCGIDSAKVLKILPSAQPYTEAEIQKMQDLEQAQLDKAYELGKQTAQPEQQWIPCNKCKYYDGAHYVKGYAPCSFWHIGGVLWNDSCKRAEPWGGEEHGTDM